VLKGAEVHERSRMTVVDRLGAVADRLQTEAKLDERVRLG
jgi:hypothetical protein